MNCYLSWDLRDMTAITAEKLQKNLNQQENYLTLYRNELLKESLKFNVASLLSHLCLNRSSFGTDDFDVLATDCLIVFFHSCAFLKNAFFTPTDVENPALAKACKNLHRLMLENVKATMKYIDYKALLDLANNNIEREDLLNHRQNLYNKVFPSTESFDLCPNAEINDNFLNIVDKEQKEADCFIDFDVQRSTTFNDAFCLMFSKIPRQEAELIESEYGVISSSKASLATPFIKYGNSFYSFVTSYSFNNIREILSNMPFAQNNEKKQEKQDEVNQEETISDTIREYLDRHEPQQIILPVKHTRSVNIDDIFDDDDFEDIITEEEENLYKDSAYVETDEDEYPDEFEEDYSNSQEELEKSGDVYEVEDEDQTETEEVQEQETIVEEDSPVEDDVAYSGFDDNDSEEAEIEIKEPKEQTILEDADYEEDDNNQQIIKDDDYDPYHGESLFSLADDEEESLETEEAKQEETSEELIQKQDTPPEEDSIEEEVPNEEQLIEEEKNCESTEPKQEDVTTLVEDSNEESSNVEQIIEDKIECESTEPEQGEETTLEEDSIEEEVSNKEQIVEDKIDCESTESEQEEISEEPIRVEESTEKESLPLIKEILKYSPTKSNEIYSYLSNCDERQQKELVRTIDLAKKSYLHDGKDKMFLIPNTTISIAIFSESHDPMVSIQRRENIGAVMYSSSKDNWNSLELCYNNVGHLTNASYNKISRKSFSDWEWKIVEKLGNRILERKGK